MKYWLCFLLSFSCFAVIAGRNQPDRHRQTFENEKKARAAAATKTPVILYHGGPVMVGPKDLYVIYYGNFTSTQHAILDNFLQNLGGSGAFNVNGEYFDASGNTIVNILNYSPTTDSFNDAYSLGKSLSGSFDTTIIHNAIANGHLPSDPNGIYILTISPDVQLPKSVWCAYHTHSSNIVAGEDIKYAVAPDPPPSLYAGCSGNVANFADTSSPNGDIGMDAVADDLIHELSETATDPDLSAWFTKNGQENGDLCNFVYGTTFLAPNGSHANHVFGTRNYLVQTIWDRVGSFCALSH
jgi:Phosphate-induced protein 1 conserved region